MASARPAPAPAAPSRRRLLLALTLAHFLTDLAQGAVPALGPFLRQLRGLSYAEVGALSLVLSGFGSVLQPLAGAYSDRARSGRLIPLALLASAVGLVGTAAAPGFAGLLASVSLVGIGVALLHPEAMRAAYDLGRGEGRATFMSWFQVGGNAGYGLGPATASAVLTTLGQPGLAVLAAPLLLWAGVMARLRPHLRAAGAFGPPSTAAAGSPSHPAGSAADHPAAAAGDRWRELGKVVAVGMLRSVLQLSLVTFVPLYYVDVLGGDPHWAGALASAYLLAGAAGTLAGGPIADRVGLRRYQVWAMAALVPLHALTLLAPGPWAAVALAAQGFVLVSTFAVSAVLAQACLPSRPALAAGLNVGLGIGAGGLGAGLVGLVADRVGLVPAMYGLTAVPALAAAVAASLRAPEEKRAPAGARG